jgi:hypothetical protein
MLVLQHVLFSYQQLLYIHRFISYFGINGQKVDFILDFLREIGYNNTLSILRSKLPYFHNNQIDGRMKKMYRIEDDDI